jgi:hypothetical protein
MARGEEALHQNLGLEARQVQEVVDLLLLVAAVVVSARCEDEASCDDGDPYAGHAMLDMEGLHGSLVLYFKSWSLISRAKRKCNDNNKMKYLDCRYFMTQPLRNNNQTFRP